MRLKYNFLILPVLFCLIYACQEDLNTIFHQEEIKREQNIKEARAIFETLSPDFPCLQARSANAATKSVIIEPIWDGAFEDENEEYKTVESNISLSKPFYMMDKAAYDAYKQTKDARYMNYLSRAVVLTHKKTGVADAFIMTIVGSKKYMEEHDFQLWSVSYCNIPEDFSGMILYYSLNGTFVNGWQVKENKQILPCHPITREDADLLARSSSGCYYVEVTNTYVDCITYSGTTFTTYEGEQFSYDFSDVVCGDPYDETYTYLVCDDSNGSSNDNSGGYSPPQLSNGKKLFNKYTGIAFEKIENFINFLRTEDCISQKILSYFEEDSIPNYEPVNLSIDPNKASVARYDTLQNTIYLNNLENFKNINMYEEIIHIIQRYKYSEEELSNGALNMEFEAKLLIDFIFVREYEYFQTDLHHIMGRKKDDTSLPLEDYLLSDEVLPFNYDRYFHYMTLWKEYTDSYKNFKMDLTIKPKLIPHIVNQLGPSCLSPI